MGNAQNQGMRGGGLAVRIDEATSSLFSDCLKAFHAFIDLDQLAEDLRILSLNAELAAGRAGDRGRAVRALTQYTRALVSRLASVQGDILHVRSDTYINSAKALNELFFLRQFERAALACRGGEEDNQAKDALEKAQGQVLEQLRKAIANMLKDVAILSERTNQVLEVVSQSGSSIATNIAVEAASAGQYEIELRTVAQTMRRYVDMLREIGDKANSAIRSATRSGQALQSLASGRTKHG